MNSPEDGEPSRLIVVEGVEVSILGRSVSYLDENGRLVTEKFEEYTKRNILSCYGTEEAFRAAWNGPTSKRVILEELEKRGVMLKELRKELGNPDLDEFDMIRHIAFGAPMLTRKLRAARVKSARFLERYQGTARAVLEKLLDAYEENGVSEIDGVDALRACANLGGVKHLLPEFNGKEGYMEALRAMQHELYEEEEEPA